MRLGNSAKSATRSGTRVIETTFSDIIGKLLDELDETDDDAAIVASLKRIFNDCDVRFVRSLAPVRLISNESAPGLNQRAASRDLTR
jgi:hypothetical protein